MTLSEIEKKLVAFAEREFSGSVSSDVVAEAEKSFAGTFPSDFVVFLSNYGSGFVESEEFIGLGGPDHLNIVSMANHLRSASSHCYFPVNYVPVRGDGFGNYDCIDLEASTPEISTVVAWLHDAGEDQCCEVLAKGYWEWFSGVLDIASGYRNENGF